MSKRKVAVLGGSCGIGAAMVRKFAASATNVTFSYAGSASVAAALAAETGAAYPMTKSAVQGLVRGLARDLGDRGITVNSIQPGPTDTDMNPADGSMAATMHGFMAIKRHIRATEVADYAAFLASPSAAMITGSMQTIDGGFGA